MSNASFKFVGWRRRDARPQWCGVVSGDSAAECRQRLVRYLACEGGYGLAVALPVGKEPHGADPRATRYEQGRMTEPVGRRGAGSSDRRPVY